MENKLKTCYICKKKAEIRFVCFKNKNSYSRLVRNLCIDCERKVKLERWGIWRNRINIKQ